MDNFYFLLIVVINNENEISEKNKTIPLPILDENITLKTLEISEDFELGSSKTVLCYILKSLSYCYMNIRDYKEAIKCLDEAEELLGEKIPDIFYRRSQARLFNKDSNYSDLLSALKDINKAIANIKHESQREFFIKQFNLLNETIEKKRKEISDNFKSKKFTNNI